MKTQVNVRLSDEEVKELDELRMKIAHKEGAIPTRSDVVRAAIKALIKNYGSGQKAD
jgi:Arc/MetJ-type ribon-helix-helix transcriptional regulator